MKLLFLFVLFFGFFGVAHAQGAFDSACYFPKLGVPSEIDSIYGSTNEQHLGQYMFGFPPTTDFPVGTVGISGLPENPPFLSMVAEGPSFNLHKLSAKLKKSNISIQNNCKFGPFHDSKHIDMFRDGTVPRIYWADDNGEFDSSRYTDLFSSIMGNAGFVANEHTYAAYLESDSVYDLVKIVLPEDTTPLNVRLFYIHFQGGEHLYNQGKIAHSDSSYQLFGFDKIDHALSIRYLQGDFRGTGREDLIVSDDSGNWCFYRNDPPFSMENFTNAVYNDTLLTVWENADTYPKQYGSQVLSNTLSSQILPHPDGDKSQDIMLGVQDHNSTSGRDHIKVVFRGGASFGSNRIKISEGEFVFHNPWYYDISFDEITLADKLIDCGDMTGTGNKVFAGLDGVPGYYLQFFYTMGKAIDDKADIYYLYETQGGMGGLVPLDADGDKYKDVLLSDDRNTSEEDVNKGKSYVGTIHLIHGSNKIPVHLNPKYAVEEINHLRQTEMYAFPNPFEERTVLTFENCSRGVMYMDVVNTLGQSVLRETLPDVDGYQQYAADLTALPAGAYYIRLVCPADGWSATASVIKTGAAEAAWKFDLHELVK
jgi:hypothetical protein